MPDTPDLTAELDRIARELRTFGANGDDTERLLDAVGKVLEKADDWEREAARLQQVARKQARAGADAGRRGATGGLAVAHIDCAKALRAAITTALAGEETGGDAR